MKVQFKYQPYKLALIVLFGLVGCVQDGDQGPAQSSEQNPPQSPVQNPPQNPVQTPVESVTLKEGMQEEIWIKRARGQDAEAAALEARLLEALNSSNYREIPHPLANNGRHVLLFEEKIEAIFKPDGVPASENELYLRTATDPRAYDRADSEVAAYRMDRQLLGFDIVLPTLPFVFNGTKGSIQYLGNGMQSGVAKKTPNTAKLQVFDYIIGNDDGHIGNRLYWPAENRRISIDHGLAFRNLEGGCFYQNALFVGQRISCDPYPHLIAVKLLGLADDDIRGEPEFKVNVKELDTKAVQTIKNITHEQVSTVLQDFVEPRYIRRVNERMDQLRTYFIFLGI